MKTSRKRLLAVALLLCVAGSSLVAYGYLFASSNTVQVNMQYKVDLSLVSVVDSAITLNAAVTYNGAPVRAGILVDFYISVDGGASTYFASSTTDAGGIAQTTYIATYNGKFDFQATVTVP